MIRVSIVCTAAASAVVAFYGLGGTKAKDWILTGIPTWFQGIGTLAAALVGYWALNAWRDQERLRRRADAAERLASATAHVVFTMRACRPRQAIPKGAKSLDRAVKKVVQRKLDTHFDKLTDVLVPCQLEIVATGPHLSKELSENSVEICRMAVKLQAAWRGIVFAEEDKISAEDADHRKVISELLEVLGVIEEDNADSMLMKPPERDPFADKLTSTYDEFMSGIKNVLTLSPDAH